MSTTISLQNAFYRARDMEKADRFYGGLLGASLKFADGTRWRQYEIGGRKFALASEEEAHPQMRGAALVFETDDIEAGKAKALALGGRILETRDMGPHGVTIVVADPEGNILHLWARASSR
ncbi:MAG: VOC family protein [Pseudochelatococcus sp.]|uniref:VOC family protein n=1 Tax=Pseudochelatococcus sp. TaxID=2020869 RepID=UPI003D92F620